MTRSWKKIQSFVLDALAPLTAITEKGDDMASGNAKNATLMAIELIGNCQCQTVPPEEGKVISSVNKSLLPLVKEDDNFKTAAPLVFGVCQTIKRIHGSGESHQILSPSQNEARTLQEALF